MSIKTCGFLSLINEELACRREPGNVHDPCAVAVKRYCRPRTAENECMFLSPAPRACINYGRGVQETKIKPTKICFLT